jgi:hypothetical protein
MSSKLLGVMLGTNGVGSSGFFGRSEPAERYNFLVDDYSSPPRISIPNTIGYAFVARLVV